MRTLKELLPLKKAALDPALLDEKTVFYICKRVLIEEYGVRGGENIIPSFYKEKKLFLTPRSSLWSSEVWLQRDRIKDRINIMLGCEGVVEVKISQ